MLQMMVWYVVGTVALGLLVGAWLRRNRRRFYRPDYQEPPSEAGLY